MSDPSIDPVVRRRTVLVGLIGQGVSPSLSPAMHELEGARHGMHYVYRTIDLAPDEATESDVSQLLVAARRLGFTGLNITHPVKQTILPLLDELAPTAERVGAVNTVVFDGEKTVGHNTDATGFGAALDDALAGAPTRRVVLVGAGGAGSAVASALSTRDIAELVIVDIDPDRATSLADTIRPNHRGTVAGAPLADIRSLLDDADGIVNATPFGMEAHPGAAFDLDLICERHWVAEIVYRPAETLLLSVARERGCRTMSGLGMAMHQAADAFEIFTGERADRTAMLSDLTKLVAAEATANPAPQGTMRGRQS